MVHSKEVKRMQEKSNEVKRMSLSLPAELEQAVIELRKTERFCRCSYAEIIRALMQLGLESINAAEQ